MYKGKGGEVGGTYTHTRRIEEVRRTDGGHVGMDTRTDGGRAGTDEWTDGCARGRMDEVQIQRPGIFILWASSHCWLASTLIVRSTKNDGFGGAPSSIDDGELHSLYNE